MRGGTKLTDSEANEILKLVRYKVARMVSKDGDAVPDPEALEQVAMLRILRRMDGYAPSRGSFTTYLHQIVDSTLSDEQRRRRAAKRDYRRNACSLNEPVSGGHGEPRQLAELIDHENQQFAFGRRRRPERELDDLAIDVAEWLHNQPPHERQLLCDLQTGSVSEVAQWHGVARGTIYRHLKAIRQRLEDSSLREYLD